MGKPHHFHDADLGSWTCVRCHKAFPIALHSQVPAAIHYSSKGRGIPKKVGPVCKDCVNHDAVKESTQNSSNV